MPKTVWYSVSPFGTADIKTGSPTIIINGGVATLSETQTGNIGCGCNITFGSTSVYIAPNRIGFSSGSQEIKVGDRIVGATSGARGIVRQVELLNGSWAGGDASGYIYFEATENTWQNGEQIDRDRTTSLTNLATTSTTLQGNIGNGNTEFVVKTATGDVPADVSAAQTVISIHHEYASLADFEAGFTDADHINNTDLTSSGADVIAHACCYYDHNDYDADTNIVTIDFGTTDADHYLYSFTPVGGSESVNKQRHDGRWNNNKYRIEAASAQGEGTIYSYSATSLDLRFDGLQINNTLTAPGNDTGVIKLSNQAFKLYLSNSLLKFEDTTSTGTDLYHSGLRFDAQNTSGSLLKVENVIVYDINTPNTSEYTNGFLLQAENAYLYNCTAINCLWGFNRELGTATVKNCLAQDCSDGFRSTFDSSSDYNCSDISGDAPGSNSVTGTVTFLDAANDDYHLASTDTVAKDTGSDLSNDPNLPIWRDIDGEDRVGGTWDIGADEYVDAGGQTIHGDAQVYGIGNIVVVGNKIGKSSNVVAGIGDVEVEGTAIGGTPGDSAPLDGVGVIFASGNKHAFVNSDLIGIDAIEIESYKSSRGSSAIIGIGNVFADGYGETVPHGHAHVIGIANINTTGSKVGICHLCFVSGTGKITNNGEDPPTERGAGMAFWIKQLKKGALHKQLGFPEDEKIPSGLLHKIDLANIGDIVKYQVDGKWKKIKVTEKLKKRVRAALTLAKLRK